MTLQSWSSKIYQKLFQPYLNNVKYSKLFDENDLPNHESHHDHDHHRWKSVPNLGQLLLNIFRHRKWLLFPIFVLVFLFFYTLTVSKPTFGNRFVLPSLILTKSNINEYSVKQINQNKTIEIESDERNDFEDSSLYLVLTENCQLKSWPLFDWQTKKLYKNIPATKSYDCSGKKSKKPVTILRENRTWIRWKFSNLAVPWNCYASEMKFNGDNDGLTYGPELGPLPRLSNFDSDLMSNISDKTLALDKQRQKWDAVKIRCNRTDSKSGKEISYSRAIPLVQNYQIRDKPRFKAPNVLMLGIDSVSRLNFNRHFLQTKHFIEQQGFIPLLGHHKVGENTFPNMMPIFTGHAHTHYWNESINDKLRFDNVPLIFYEYQRKGYLTSFIEDMPPYGIFTYKKKGFRKQPTDYYLRPVNLAIWPSLYNDRVCYQGEIEYEIYYQFLLELFDLYREQGSPPHLTIAQWATLTHDYLNKAGYADQVFSRFIQKIFARQYNTNTVIIFYSDHGIRMGPIQKTLSGIHEQRLPFLYLYIPDSVEIDGLTASQLRKIIRGNQHRLTSQYDIHATLRHILEGKPPSQNEIDEPYGRSLFTEIPENRTCPEAGISTHYCMCNDMVSAPVTKDVDLISQFLIDELNRHLKPFNSICANLTLNSTLWAMVSQDEVQTSSNSSTSSIGGNSSIESHQRHYLVQFKANPSEGIFQSTVLVTPGSTANRTVIGDISRIDRYGHQSRCIKHNFLIEQYCFCLDNNTH